MERTHLSRLFRRGVLAMAVVPLLVAGCGDDEDDDGAAASTAGATAAPSPTTPATPATPTTSGGSGSPGSGQMFAATLAAPEGGGDGVTYDPAAAPVDAELMVTLTEENSSTTFLLEVTGMMPDRGYAVHAHVDPCGATGDAAGPHFQNEIDPAGDTGCAVERSRLRQPTRRTRCGWMS